MDAGTAMQQGAQAEAPHLLGEHIFEVGLARGSPAAVASFLAIFGLGLRIDLGTAVIYRLVFLPDPRQHVEEACVDFRLICKLLLQPSDHRLPTLQKAISGIQNRLLAI